jgi:hypothetical protein
MRRTRDTFDARYQAELILIELFAVLVLLFLLSTGASPSPVTARASAVAAPPAVAPVLAKPVVEGDTHANR